MYYFKITQWPHGLASPYYWAGFNNGMHLFKCKLLILKECGKIGMWNNRVTGCVGLILKRMGVVLMKNKFSFNDLMQFGLFLIALLTFIYLISH